MAGHERLSNVKSRWNHLRRDTAATAGEIQRALQLGAHRLATQERRLLDLHLRTLADALHAAHTSGRPSEIASRQLVLLRELVQRVIANARESLAIVAATRMELVTLMKKSAKKGGAKAAKKTAAKSKLAGVKAKAKKAVASVKAKAKKVETKAKKAVSKAKTKVKAAAKKPAAKAKKVQAQAKKVQAKAKKAVASAKKSVVKAQKTVKKDVAKLKAKAKVQVKKAEAQVKVQVKKAEAQVKKVEAQVKKAAVDVEKKVVEVATPVVTAVRDITPSPLSRAFLATSAGKKEAERSGLSTASDAPAQMGLGLPDSNGNNNSGSSNP